MAADHHSASTNFSFDVVQLMTSPYHLKLRQQPRRSSEHEPTSATAPGVDCFPCTKKHQELFLGSQIPDCCWKTWEEVLGLVRTKAAFTMSGYIVRLDRAILTKLRDSFYDSAVGMIRAPPTGERWRVWAPDVTWRRVMTHPKVNWFMAKPMIGIQRPSWSNLEGKNVSYPVPKGLM
eukprot:GHVU01115955.1.p1 GENE.GHVU01115955.1~~GHVU01115955.1.p1  ORF type:complete len:187 (-),score=10.37 GHVU01115955.1:166-696(-)